MGNKVWKKARKTMRKFVHKEYDKELRGMCSYPLKRRIKIALCIILKWENL